MTTTTPTAAVVQLLIETCKDGQESFSAAAAEIQDPALKARLEAMARERQIFAEELAGVLGELGEEYGGSGGLIASLHRSWLDFRFALSAGDESTILADCERAEARSVEEYREALGAPELHAQIRVVVQRQFAAIEAAAQRVRAFVGGRGG